MAARLVKLCRYYIHLFPKDKSFDAKTFNVAHYKVISWNAYVDILADYAIADVDEQSKNEVEKLIIMMILM